MSGTHDKKSSGHTYGAKGRTEELARDQNKIYYSQGENETPLTDQHMALSTQVDGGTAASDHREPPGYRQSEMHGYAHAGDDGKRDIENQDYKEQFPADGATGQGKETEKRKRKAKRGKRGKIRSKGKSKEKSKEEPEEEFEEEPEEEQQERSNAEGVSILGHR